MPVNNSRTLIRNVSLVAVGVLVVAVIVFTLQAALGLIQVKSTPPGWEIIRPPGEVYTILVDNDTVWTGGKEGIIRISRIDRFRIPLPPGAPPTSYVRQIFRDSRGTIWIAHDGGLLTFSGETWTVISPAPGVPFHRVMSIVELPDGSMVAGSDTDAFILTGTGWESLTSRGMPQIALAEVLLVTRDGDLWVGCGEPLRGALLRFDGATWFRYTADDGLPHPAVRALMEDSTGAVWAATGYSRNGGAARYHDGAWTSFTVSDGLAGESTRSVYEDKNGRIWIGSEYDGIAAGNNRTWTILSMKDGLAGNEVKTMIQDADGAYWLGTEKGLSWIAPSALTML